MSRSTRLFEIIQILRTAMRPLRAVDIAQVLEVSERTIYRDMAALQAMRVPIIGEAGVGYVMRRGYDLPPVNFDADEAEAVAVGLTMIARIGDTALTQAARRAARKLHDVPDVSAWLMDAGYGIKSVDIDLSMLRNAIRDEVACQIDYEDIQGQKTSRQIWPLALIFYPETGVLVARCLLRQDFRHFRLDRILKCLPCTESFAGQGNTLRQDWARTYQDQMVG